MAVVDPMAVAGPSAVADPSVDGGSIVAADRDWIRVRHHRVGKRLRHRLAGHVGLDRLDVERLDVEGLDEEGFDVGRERG